jgi:phage gpG-like protein
MTWKVVKSDWDVIEARLLSNAKALVAKAALDWEAQAKSIAKAKGVYLTGTLINSIQATQISEYEWVVRVNVEYGAYNEYGTVHMAARPYFGPAGMIVRPQFIAALKQILR